MYESDYYPAGAYYDKNAPYNQPDDHEFDEQIYERIDGEMDDNDSAYLEWLDEKILAYKFENDELENVAMQLAEVESIREMYREYRYEDARDAYFNDPSNFEEPEEDYEDEY